MDPARALLELAAEAPDGGSLERIVRALSTVQRTSDEALRYLHRLIDDTRDAPDRAGLHEAACAAAGRIAGKAANEPAPGGMS